MRALPWRLVLATKLEGFLADEPGGAGQRQETALGLAHRSCGGPGGYYGCRVSPGARVAAEAGHERLVGSVHMLSDGGR